MNVIPSATPDAVSSEYVPHARAERLIAGGRFVLAFFSLGAIYFEPSTPAHYLAATYFLLTVYVVYALIAAIKAWHSPISSRNWRLASHVLDLILFSVFIFLTEGPASPFFVYFVFSMFCATLRFTWRGILATAAAAFLIYVAMAVAAALTDQSFEPTRVLIRMVYLGVVAALLIYLGAYHQRLRFELASLAAWPRRVESKLDDLLGVTLRHAAAVLHARRLLMLWEEHEEPWLHTATWIDGVFNLARLPPGSFETGDARVRNTSYFVTGENRMALIYDPARGTVSEEECAPIGDTLRREFQIEGAIGVGFEGTTFSGHLFALDARSATADDLALAHIVGRLVAATLEQFFFLQHARQTASTEERLRISRELHDGIVQSLGGVGLQLQSVVTQIGPGLAAFDRLTHIQRVIEQDQRELRAIVRELRPQDTREQPGNLTDDLQRIRERFALEWGLGVDIDAPANGEITSPMAHEICRIVNESLANAARHGSATRATVAVTPAEDAVHVRVSDNGRGFAFAGRFDMAELNQRGHGPKTLKERLTRLGGSLVVESSTSGATIEASLPLFREAI